MPSNVDHILNISYWELLVQKCKKELEKKDKLKEVDSFEKYPVKPLNLFYRMDVEKSVGRFVYFIVWLSRRRDAYWHFRHIVLVEPDLCLRTLCRLAVCR